MQSRSINAVIDSIIRPSTCFANISENPRYYFRPSVIIFVIAAVSAFLSTVLNVWYWNYNGQSNLDFSVLPLFLSSIITLFQNIVLIAGIFWIGKKLGGNTNFRKIFSAISYCLVPVTIAALLIPVGITLATDSLATGTGVTGGGSINIDPTLSPSYALDFMSSAMISYGFLIPFVFWMFILFVKAIMITNNFNFKKSILTVLCGVAIVYLSHIVFAIPSQLLSFL